MYQEHEVMIQPDNENIKVWRYIDFTKLVSLLDTQCLYFTRVDKFDDTFEGSWPQMNITARNRILSQLLSDQIGLIPAVDSRKDLNKKWPKFNAVNCWHMNNHESAAMWKLYLKSDEGVAIQTTYKDLRQSLIDEEAVYMGTVKYIDYEIDGINNSNMFSPIMHKRKSFEHEQEVRAVVFKPPVTADLDAETIRHGLLIKVNMNLLIQKIFVAPTSSIWFTDLVKSVVERYGYKFDVVNSRLNDQPLF